MVAAPVSSVSSEAAVVVLVFVLVGACVLVGASVVVACQCLRLSRGSWRLDISAVVACQCLRLHMFVFLL